MAELEESLAVTSESRRLGERLEATTGLKANRSIVFSCVKMIFTVYVLRSLRQYELKPEGQNDYKQKALSQSYKSQIQKLTLFLGWPNRPLINEGTPLLGLA